MPLAIDRRHLQTLQMALALLLGIWLAWNLGAMLWAFYPKAGDSETTVRRPMNEIEQVGTNASGSGVDLQRMVDWNLFGALSAQPAEKPVVISNEVTDIERDAKETRLKLLLRGVVASDAGEEGRAMIEAQGRQELYSLGDKLPVGGRVTIARILPDRVVLDNAGRYELLRLYEEKGSAVGVLKAPEPEAAETVTIKNDPNVAEMAGDYRQRLYSNPQSLADVVKVSAVRQGGEMRGYRVSPGRDRDQFAALGFEANDIVTSVNGIELNDPAKAMQLYQLMRTATEANFTVLRGDVEQSLVVSLGDAVQ